MKRRILFLLMNYFLLTCYLVAQPKSQIVHYSLDDGLPQRSIMSILQDKKGFMWFATWDGLCKFDGYNFKTFKTAPGDSVFMLNNRIDNIHEDAFGYIWLWTYNREAFRFNPKTEKYVMSIHVHGKTFHTDKIRTMPSGSVWLTSPDMGAVCVPDSSNRLHVYSVENSLIPDNYVEDVYEDSDLYAWILTKGGLTRVPPCFNRGEGIKNYFSGEEGNNNQLSFLSVVEIDNEIWFGTETGTIMCYDKNEERFSTFVTGAGSAIISMQKVYDNLLIILTANDGFMLCDKNRANLRRYNQETLPGFPINQMKSCFIDSNHNIWLEINNTEVARFNLLEDKLKIYPPAGYVDLSNPTPPPFFILEDKSGRIWVHPHGRFSYYDKETDQLRSFYNNPRRSDWKFSDLLHDVFLDRQGNVWLSTHSGGVEKIVFDNALFRLNVFYPNTPLKDCPEVRAIFQDNDLCIWLGSKDGIISIYNPDKTFKGYLCTNGKISPTGTPLKGTPYTFFQDKEKNIWIGTKGEGLFILTPEEEDGNSYSIRQFLPDPSDPYSLNSNSIYTICEDNAGHIWIGTYGEGINIFDSKTKRFINPKNILKNYPVDTGKQVRSMVYHEDKIYIGTTFGLIVFSLEGINPEEWKYRTYSKDNLSKEGLPASDIYNIFISKKNDIYISTFGGGMAIVTEFDREGFPLKFKTYNTGNGLHSDIILSVIEDNNEHLWINSEGNLSRFDPEKETFDFFNDVSRVLDKYYFSEAIPLLTREGEIIYGCMKGTLSFTPDKNQKNEYRPYLALTNFKISNHELPFDNKVDDMEKIILTHRENIFSIEYATLDYTNPKSIAYAYKLEGFDDDWQYNKQQRIASYTNLAPGEYIFRVKSTNSNGAWTGNERNLPITIKPSFWQTRWAYGLYIIAISIILFSLLRSVFSFFRMRDKVLLEQEQTEMKTRFFTDISHEIRTPLTMIVSPVENILENEKTHPEIKPQLELILRNANRMLRMVNQILDFRKIQKQKLQVRETVIGDYINELRGSSLGGLENQGVSISFNNTIPSERVWIDPESVEKLVYNLLSNSLKYTGKGKNVEISLFKKEKMVGLQVKDEGKGMTKEVMGKLFTRFASFNTDKNKPSTGIGLSIVKEVADKHHARIQVESDVNKGSCFTIWFHQGLEHFKEDEYVEIIYSETTKEQKTEDDPTENEEPATLDDSRLQENENSLSILIIEDDEDLRGFIRSVLSPYYTTYEAGNGREGYEAALKLIPDFILSDIMMPEMDGIEFLQKIRENVDTSHIPLILLTAKTNVDNKLEGISLGADDYITKPFNVKLLLAKIDNIIQRRKRFSEYLMESSSKEDKTEEIREFVSENKITPQDEQFLQLLQEEVNNNLDNSDFTIDDLASKTNLSRRLFFNKVKSLTGMAPIQFVREIRIRHAANLLQCQEYRIKEVTYMVGFSDIRYFTQCFKEMYGMTPSQYKEQFKNPG